MSNIDKRELLGVQKHANQHRLSHLTMEVHTDELRIMASAVESYTDELIAALESAKQDSAKWFKAFEKAVSVGARYEERIEELTGKLEAAEKQIAEMDVYRARRVSACIAACEGISTENLVNNVPIKQGLRGLNARIREADGELEALRQRIAELDNSLCELLPGTQYMDPPDGGNVTPLEQVRRMIADYRHRIAELENSETQLINERDNAEAALADMYQAATGERPEWSNMFGFADAVDAVEERLATLESGQGKPVMFIDGDISQDDADKLAAVIREFNEDTETPAAKMARIIRENPHPTNMCDMPAAGIGKGE